MPRRHLPGALQLQDPPAELRWRFAALRTRADVAALLGITPRQLGYLLHRRPPLYFSFDIPKKGGGTRTIAAPSKQIKFYQRRLAQVLTAVYRRRSPVHGFALGCDIVSNARQHIGRDWVFNIDLADFFPSIHFGRVSGIFRGYGVGRRAAEALATVLQ